jgi:hypothetical protein
MAWRRLFLWLLKEIRWPSLLILWHTTFNHILATANSPTGVVCLWCYSKCISTPGELVKYAHIHDIKDVKFYKFLAENSTNFDRKFSPVVSYFYARILKAHSHSHNEWKFNLSFSQMSLLFLNSWRVSVIPYYCMSMWLLTFQLFKNSIFDTQ